jgi:subtilisin family serine protease
MEQTLRLFFLTVVFILISTLPSGNLITGENDASGNYTNYKFFVKSKIAFNKSEATGTVTTKTGIKSVDDLNRKFKVKQVKEVFKLNNGNQEIYLELGMNRIYSIVIETEGNYPVEKIVEEYSKLEEIEYSELNYSGKGAGRKNEFNPIEVPFQVFSMSPNDLMFNVQWYLKNDGSMMPTTGREGKQGADINMLPAYEIEQGSDDIIVAILDSGIKYDHPEFKGRIWINTNEIPGNGVDDDRNGYIDDTIGWDFAYDDPNPTDGFGHGTNIATVIGANTNNKIGFAGVNTKCKLMNCKNLTNDNSGEYEWWAESVKYAVDNGAKVINMSEGGDENSRVLKTAVDYATKRNVTVVAAMMNRANNKNYYPAAFNGVIAVGATDTDDWRCKRFTWGGGSCWGKHISVVAPGNKIYGLDYLDDDKYDVSWSGTSQSTAIVSAMASLLYTQVRTRTPKDILTIITSTSKDMVGDPSEDKAGWDQYMGYGRVDCYDALMFEKGIISDNRNNKKEKVEITGENNKNEKRFGGKGPDEKKNERSKAEEEQSKSINHHNERNTSTEEPSPAIKK